MLSRSVRSNELQWHREQQVLHCTHLITNGVENKKKNGSIDLWHRVCFILLSACRARSRSPKKMYPHKSIFNIKKNKQRKCPIRCLSHRHIEKKCSLSGVLLLESCNFLTKCIEYKTKGATATATTTKANQKTKRKNTIMNNQYRHHV